MTEEHKSTGESVDVQATGSTPSEEEKDGQGDQANEEVLLGVNDVDADFKIAGGLMSQRKLSPKNDKSLTEVFARHGMSLW